MQASTVTLRLRALPRMEYRRMLGEHPQREGNAADESFGANSDTFFEALLRASVVDPTLSAEQWDRLLAAITDGQFDVLVTAALSLNRRDVSVPFSPAASAVIRGSVESSRPPAAGG
jgi:hypothetical protein